MKGNVIVQAPHVLCKGWKRYIQRMICLTVLGILAFIGGCAAKTEEQVSAPDGRPKLQVVSTIFPPADFVRQIGGDYVEVTQLLKPGMEAHSYEPAPMDIIRIGQSDLFLYAGGESDVWVEEVLEGNDGNVLACSLLDWADPLEEETVEGMQVTGHHHEHSGEAERSNDAVHLEEGEYDEHVWTSPANAILLAERIRDTMCALDPARKDIYQKNAEAYLGQLKELDAQYRSLTANARRNVVVFGDRFPFLYLARNYGLKYYAAFPGCSQETEPNAATLAFLTDKVKEEGIPVIFQLELSNGRIARTLAEVTGADIQILHSCHTLTKEEQERGETYLSLMRRNLSALEKALNE